MKQDEKFKRRQERFDRNFVRNVTKTLSKLEEIRNEIDGIELIYDNLYKMYVNKERINKNKPVIGTFCYMVPDEIIIACGGFPVKLCGGNYAAQIAGDEISPRDSCPIVKSAIGSFSMNLLPVYEDCELAIVPTTCDCKRKMIERISKYTKVLPMHIPALKDEKNIENIIPLYHSVIIEIEKVTNIKLTKKNLKKAIKLTQEINKEARIFMNFKKEKNPVITGSQSLAIINSYQYMDREEYLMILKKINKSLKAKKKSKETLKDNMPRILLTGSPVVFPNYKLPLVIESLNSIICADETCAGDRMLSDPVCVLENDLEGMIRALVIKSILPCSCPTFSFNDDRLYRLKQMIIDYKIEGILYNVLRGCIPYDFEQKNVEELAKELDIPIISVETDYNTEDTEQIKIRLEAFVEMLKMR